MYRNHLEKLARTRLDDVLVDEGILDRPQLEAAQAEQDQSGRLLSDVLIDSTAIDEWDLAKLMSSHFSLPFIDVKLYSISANVLELLPLDWCRQHSILPFDQFGKTLGVACAEMPTTEVVQEITTSTGCMPFLYVGVRRAIREVLDETIKRRGGRTAPASSLAAGASAQQSATGTKKSISSQPAEQPALPAIDLPRVSLKLNASAAGVAASGALVVKKPQIERFGRPVPAPPPSLPAAPAGKRASSTGSQISKVSAPAPTVPAPRLPPGPGGAPARAPAPAPAVPAAAAKGAEPARPAANPRGAPAVPAAAPAKKSPAQGGGWESIFDSGDSAVRGPDEPPRK